MYRKPDPVPIEETSIWLCGEESCTGWMRQNFTFEKKVPSVHFAIRIWYKARDNSLF